MGKTGSLGSDSLKDVIDKAVHDRHGFAGYTGVWVNLLQHFVNVDGVGFPPLPPPLLVRGTGGLCLGGGLLRAFACYSLCWHFDNGNAAR